MKNYIKALKELNFKILASKMEESFIKELGIELNQYFRRLDSRNKVTVWPERKKIKLDLVPLDEVEYLYLVTLIGNIFIVVNKEPDKIILDRISNNLDSKKLARSIKNAVDQHYLKAREPFLKKDSLLTFRDTRY